MKKLNLLHIVSLLALLLLTFTVLVSCGGDTVTTTTADVTTTQASTTTTKITTAPITTTTPATTAPVTTAAPEDEWVSAIFGGGPFVTGNRQVVTAVKNSGFNTLMLWSLHIHSNGDLYLNDICVARDGKFRGNGTMKNAYKEYLAEDSSIKRIELSIGGWGCTDFEAIRDLINRDGTGEDTILYKNLKAVIEATGATAINFDDESCYDVDSMATFAKMCIDMGMKVTFCPYTNMTFWVNLKKAINNDEAVDRIYLQCYAGGSGNKNSIATWKNALKMDIIPGYWCINTESSYDSMTAAQVADALTKAKRFSTGGFMWLYDHMQSLASPNSTADYAAAINGVGKDD